MDVFISSWVDWICSIFFSRSDKPNECNRSRSRSWAFYGDWIMPSHFDGQSRLPRTLENHKRARFHLS